MKRFIITSHGWSASNWLAYVLNCHPAILCSHNATNSIPWDRHTLAGKKLKNRITEFHQGYVSRLSLDLDEHYSNIINHRTKEVYVGSVHLFRLRDLPKNVESHGIPAHSYKIMNLVRHPVTLVWSGYGQFLDLFRYDLNELHWTLGKVLSESRDFIFEISKKYDLYIGDYENLAFISACCVMGSLKKDIEALEPVKSISSFDYRGSIKMEEVTTSPEFLVSAVTQVTDKDLPISENYLERIFSMEKINRHRSDDQSLEPTNRFNMFRDWQKEVFRFYFKKFDLYRHYQKLDYDLSFI